MTDSISVAEVKRHFSDILGAVRYQDKRYVIERNGTPIAALVPLSALPEQPDQPSGLLGLVGAFSDAPELPELLADITANRDSEKSRPAPRLGQ